MNYQNLKNFIKFLKTENVVFAKDITAEHLAEFEELSTSHNLNQRGVNHLWRELGASLKSEYAEDIDMLEWVEDAETSFRELGSRSYEVSSFETKSGNPITIDFELEHFEPMDEDTLEDLLEDLGE